MKMRASPIHRRYFKVTALLVFFVLIHQTVLKGLLRKGIDSGRVTCECSYPGSTRLGENGFTCSDSSFNRFCAKGFSCLAPVGHAWHPSSPPCGEQSVANQFFEYGAYSRISLASACSRTVTTVDPSETHLCDEFEKLALLKPVCSPSHEVVPRIVHIVTSSTGNPNIERMVQALNPSFDVLLQNDKSAHDFVLKNCGRNAAEAYSCFRPPSYRADLFRFCAMYSKGGVYLDDDILPLFPLQEVVSMCSSATVGHDFPAGGEHAKQMKILASKPASRVMGCALRRILANVRRRAYPRSPLELTGPLLLQSCYEQFPEDVAITYSDTRNSLWPFTGMRAGSKILAYEYPASAKHFCYSSECSKGNADYASLFEKRKVYSEDCAL